jgi:hypothetical protein
VKDRSQRRRREQRGQQLSARRNSFEDKIG